MLVTTDRDGFREHQVLGHLSF